jgi:site-specific DNA recombinase
VHTAPVPADGQPRVYLLAGLMYCGICGRLTDSHWVHDRAGYRCRHGHTSAHPDQPTRPKILYVREDRLLERIHSDRELRRQLPELARQAADRVAGWLRTNDMIVVCDHTIWAIESDTLRIELAIAANQAFTMPVQRSDTAFHTERSSRSMWK